MGESFPIMNAGKTAQTTWSAAFASNARQDFAHYVKKPTTALQSASGCIGINTPSVVLALTEEEEEVKSYCKCRG